MPGNLKEHLVAAAAGVVAGVGGMVLTHRLWCAWRAVSPSPLSPLCIFDPAMDRVGATVPSVAGLKRIGSQGSAEGVDLMELFSNKLGVLVAVPGAFTPS
eukprot:TRINITY_DN3396_c0_g1_i1.p4 TRINITY_DN3396_c0_g1~~TRINITY_DN3396_c0_g1_i1.p4  ORF type:complete len:100 (+),score=16.21 TRINITY_DN3396_c0_g1_i1:260-559(+)